MEAQEWAQNVEGTSGTLNMATESLAGKEKEAKMTKKKKRNQSKESIVKLSELEENVNEVEEKKESRSLGTKKRKCEKINEVDSRNVGLIGIKEEKVPDDAERKKKKSKSSRRKKRKSGEKDEAHTRNGGQLDSAPSLLASGSTQSELQENILEDSDKSRKAAKKKEKVLVVKSEEVMTDEVNNIPSDDRDKSRKAAKKKKKDCPRAVKEKVLVVKSKEVMTDEVYNIPSEDRDSSKGMKKWVVEYHQSRPGLQILQQRIDDFITEHEEKEEQARKEKEDRLAEGGWTVVVHHKGRKKTTDSESGVAVGSVAQAVVLDKLAKKKSNEIGDFYRFQKREAQRSELMKLRSKFEEDKKRIQQLRAARKFQPW